MKRFLIGVVFALASLSAFAAQSFDDSSLSKTPTRSFVYNDFNDSTLFSTLFYPGTFVFDDGPQGDTHPGCAAFGGFGTAVQVEQLLPFNYFIANTVEARLIVSLRTVPDASGGLHSGKIWLGDNSYTSGSGGYNGFVIERVTDPRGFANYKVTAYNGGHAGIPVQVPDYVGDDAAPHTDSDGFVNIHFQMSKIKATVTFENANGSALRAAVSTAVTAPSDFIPAFDASPVSVNGVSKQTFIYLDYYASRVFNIAQSF